MTDAGLHAPCSSLAAVGQEATLLLILVGDPANPAVNTFTDEVLFEAADEQHEQDEIGGELV